MKRHINSATHEKRSLEMKESEEELKLKENAKQIAINCASDFSGIYEL